jgi:hypothetical protein
MTEMPAQLALFTEPQAPPPDYSGRSYSIGYWDLDKQRYVPYRIPFLTGLSVNLTRWQLRRVLRWVRGWPTRRAGKRRYRGDNQAGWRRRIGTQPRWLTEGKQPTTESPPEAYDVLDDYDSDPNVFIERTDGRKLKDILRGWRR